MILYNNIIIILSKITWMRIGIFSYIFKRKMDDALD